MAFAGLCWMISLSPPLANFLSPCNLAAGVLGEASLLLWLVVIGVNVQRWNEQASTAGALGLWLLFKGLSPSGLAGPDKGSDRAQTGAA
jgi:hypothetical protein